MDIKVYLLTVLFLAGILSFDLLHAWTQRKKEPTLRSAGTMTLIYIGMAIAFGILLGAACV